MTKIDLNQSTKEEMSKHSRAISSVVDAVGDENKVSRAIGKLKQLQIAIPSWALGTGGTRFGRFPGGGEPSSLAQKIEDVALLNRLNKSSSSISLHIPWDKAENIEELKKLAKSLDLSFDAVNSNTFQDQPNQSYSYKYGSLCHTDKEVRQLAVNHNKEVISIGENLGSKALTVWLADGSIFPGQHDFKSALNRTLDSLSEIYSSLPPDWTMLLEYKPYEPN
ncbi:MAG: sugar isomerase, partial [Paracoccaceae bacterium]